MRPAPTVLRPADHRAAKGVGSAHGCDDGAHEGPHVGDLLRADAVREARVDVRRGRDVPLDPVGRADDRVGGDDRIVRAASPEQPGSARREFVVPSCTAPSTNPPSTTGATTRSGRVRSSCVAIRPPCENPIGSTQVPSARCSSTHAQIISVACRTGAASGLPGSRSGTTPHPRSACRRVHGVRPTGGRGRGRRADRPGRVRSTRSRGGPGRPRPIPRVTHRWRPP